AGAESECRAIARWAKRHLTAGAAPDDLLVVARDIASYRPVLARVFAEADLVPPPVAAPLAQTPEAKLLMALVRTADGYRSADLLAVITNSMFSPETLGDFNRSNATTAQLIIRLGNVISGRAGYANAINRIACRVGRAHDENDEDEFGTSLGKHLSRLGPNAVVRAGKLLEALFDRLESVASDATLADAASGTRNLLALMAPQSRLCRSDEAAAAGLRALAAIDEVLAELASLRQLPGSDRRLSAGQFAQILAAVLRDTTCPPARLTGAIGVAGALDARAVRVCHLWLAGLNEGVFPAPAGQQSLIGEVDRWAWGRRGMDLPGRDDLTAREMLLFTMTISRATESLTLSWLYSDSTGRAMQRSGFVDALMAPIARWAEHVTTLPPAEFAPPAERIISRRELLNSALAATAATAGGSDWAKWAPALQKVRCDHYQTLRRLAGPLWAAHRRWLPGPCDAYDGVVDDPALLAELARLVPAEMVFSASQIDSYLSCPWRYFAEHWLKVAPLPEPDETLLPYQRGVLVHAVLRRMLATLRQAGNVDPAKLTGGDTLAALDAAIAAEDAAAAGKTKTGLWNNELRQTRSAIVDYLRRQAALPAGPARVHHLELAFGMTASGSADEASIPEPIVLPGPAGRVRLRGRIDRVDVLLGPDQPPKALVIDYKTGTLPDLKATVQLTVYIKAAEQITHLPAAGGTFHGIRNRNGKDRYLAEFKLNRGALKENNLYADQLDDAVTRLHNAVAGIAAGQFPVIGRHKCAATRCPLRRICRYSPSRTAVKLPLDQEADDD
ncbi:MAG: PD-(D/E)XK nuclease family protein, partial [Planctomycetes bacterium]|nr:PD-(D/E)XK nuclease family protein [Planctomycetota bacterium]